MNKSIVVLSLLLSLALCLKLQSHNHEGTVSEALAEQSVQHDQKHPVAVLASVTKPIQLVSNPLALNIVVDDKTKIAEEQKARLDNHDIDYEACPIQTPFWNGNKCISCKNYFNVNLKACVTCPHQTIYNPNTLRCQKITYLPNLQGEGLLVGDRKLSDWQSFQQRLIKINPITIVKCPIENPHLLNDTCGKCEGENNLYDLTTGLCDKCNVNETYDKEDRKCLSKKLITGLSNIIPTLAPVPIPHPEPTVAPTPVAVSTTETPAPQTPIKQTHPTPSAPTVENTTTTTTTTETTTPVTSTTATPTPVEVAPVVSPPVVAGHQKFVTNPETYGFIIDTQTLDQYRARYEILKSQGAEDCPGAKGYFNGKECIGCPGTNSKFQQSTNTCTVCPKGTYYKFAVRNCVPQGN